MKGSLPLPYIVAIILGIVVIVVIVFMFFTQSGIFSTTIDERFCQTKCLEYKATKCEGSTTWTEFDSRCSAIVTSCPCP